MSITQSTTDELILEQHDRVLLIKLNRPDRLNAISRDMLDELSAKVVAADKDPEIRCIVLTGEGKALRRPRPRRHKQAARRRARYRGREQSQSPPRKLFDLEMRQSMLCGIATRRSFAPSTARQLATVWTLPCSATCVSCPSTEKWRPLLPDEMWCQKAAAHGCYHDWWAGQNLQNCITGDAP